MKKAKIATLLLVCALALNACGSKNNNNEGGNASPTLTETPAEPTPTETTEDNNSGADDNFDDLMPAASDELTSIRDAVAAQYGDNYAPSMQYDKETIENLFGVAPELYDYAIAEGPMISAHVDTFAAFHATEGNADAIEEALNNYRDILVNDTFQYPMNVLKIQASKVYKNGDYVFFIMLGFIEDQSSITEDEQFIEEYAKLNQLAVDAIESILK